MERITKIMAARGMCSRREAERLISAGEVLVEGEVVREQGFKAAPDARIEIVEAGLARRRTLLTLLLHKPPGIVSTQPEAGQVPAYKLLRRDNVAGEIDPDTLRRIVADPSALSVAGRLDRASRGLLVLTQDGAVARRLIGGSGLEKVYLVRTSEPASDAQVRKLCGPLTLDGRRLRPMRVRREGGDTLRFTLVEGRYHQIRRLCRRFGLEVVDLHRIAVGPFQLGDLPEGCWRLATPRECAALGSVGR